jgi:hypothetical protein
MISGAQISATQRDALALLSELCELSPDVRLGQLMAHLGFLGEDQTGRTLWDIDDEQLLAVMYHHRDELVARTSDPSKHALDLQVSNTPIPDSAKSSSPSP